MITADRLWNGGECLDHPRIVVEDGLIASIAGAPTNEAPAHGQPLSYPGATLAPSYFDVHIHGSAGFDVMQATPEALSAVGRFLAAHGTGSYLATTVTAPLDITLRSLEGLAKWIRNQAAEDRPHGASQDQARIVGIHLEGPFLSHLRRGVHPPDLLLAPDIATFDRMFEAAEGHVRLITIAPELPGAIDLIRHAVARGVRVSVGHSDATTVETRAALAVGATSATHTFNAMRTFDHRESGIIGVALSEDTLFAELICDGIHTSREAVRIWWRSKGRDRAILVTDGMAAAGMPDGMYKLGAMEVEVKDGKATSGAVLAGSLLTLNRAVSNLIEFAGAPLEDALRAATVNPAAMIGFATAAESSPASHACANPGPQPGSLAVGQPANLVALDPAGRLVASILNGQLVKPLAS